MKKTLGIIYDKKIDGIDYDQIDGWCYTKNEKWLKDFFEHEMNKHKDLAEAYNNFKERLNKSKNHND